MVKNFLVTYGGVDSLAAINAGKYDNIRLMSGTSEVQGIEPHLPPTHPWRTARDAGAIVPSDPDSWWQFSAVAWHFGEAITDQHVKAGKQPPTLGLVSTAIGGSQIEEWITTEVASQCFGFEHNANGGFLNHITFDNCVAPFLDMSSECPRRNPTPTLTPRARERLKRTLTVIQRHPRTLTLTDTVKGAIYYQVSVGALVLSGPARADRACSGVLR